jgi:hypothetical protein
MFMDGEQMLTEIMKERLACPGRRGDLGLPALHFG